MPIFHVIMTSTHCYCPGLYNLLSPAAPFIFSYFKTQITDLFFYLLQLCLDIYLVRESGELDLVEDLFAKLIFLYRSPETLIKWTQPRKKGEGEEGNAHPMTA